MEEIKKILDEILDSVQNTEVLDPFDAGVVSTVSIIKIKLNIK